MKKPFVSVVIPVYNDHERLLHCLEALERQTYPREDYEIIVVDNNSSEKIRPHDINRYEHAKLEFEKQRGAYAARNRGIKVSKGDIIAFTDSDCRPAQDWIEKGVDNISAVPGIGFLGGKIKVVPADKNNPSSVELWECMFAFPQNRLVEERHFAATANMFTFRTVLEKEGCFRQEMLSGGDMEWGNRIYSRGYEISYSDDVVVIHPARRTLRELINKHKPYVRTHFQLSRNNKVESAYTAQRIFMRTIPPVLSIYRMVKSTEFRGIKGLANKFKLIGIMLFLRYLYTYEYIALIVKEKIKSM